MGASSSRFRKGLGKQVSIGSDYLPDYVEQGKVHLSYAVTGHRMQGATNETSHVLADELLDKQWGLVAMSRSTKRSQMHFIYDPDEEAEPLEQLRYHWQRDNREQSFAELEAEQPSIEQTERARRQVETGVRGDGLETDAEPEEEVERVAWNLWEADRAKEQARAASRDRKRDERIARGRTMIKKAA